MNFTFDTHAWIEYFEGSREGGRVKSVLESGSHELYTPSIVLAELSDAAFRGRVRADLKELMRFVALNTRIVDIDEGIASESGRLKNALRKRHADAGLTDAIVLASARAAGSQLLTGDSHLTSEEGVIDIQKDFSA